MGNPEAASNHRGDAGRTTLHKGSKERVRHWLPRILKEDATSSWEELEMILPVGVISACGRFLGLGEGEGKGRIGQAVPTQKRIWNTEVRNQ